jgi:saxitoxin biosynthesis operon SxtJ-like protein
LRFVFREFGAFVSVHDVLGRVGLWFAGLPTYKQALLVFATTVFVVELILRRVARGTRLYARWTAAFEALGAFWSAIILSIVYFVSVAIISIFMKLTGKDLLDRTLAPEPSFWRPHEPNPLGPLAAARHQF